MNHLTPHQQYYYAWCLSHKKSYGDDSRYTGVLSEALVDLNPHQVEAALFAFNSPLSKGAILADEVGLGKTIEAGIILSQLWSEHRRRILIIVPASLRSQWSNELFEKFHLHTTILDSTSIDIKKNQIKNPFIQDSLIICSYHFAVKYIDEIKKVTWDLIVYDEAHKLRNVYKKTTLMANILKKELQPFKKILLTATPLQNNLKELYGLISIIDDNFFGSPDIYSEQYNALTLRDNARFGSLAHRLQRIVHRTLRSQVQEYVNYTKRISIVQDFKMSDKENQLYIQFGEYLRTEGSLGLPDNQKTLLILVLRKIMASSSYALSFTIERMIERIKSKHNINIVDLCSSVATENDDWIDEDIFDEADIYNSATSLPEISELERFKSMALYVGVESKAKSLLSALEIGFAKLREFGANEKALIFTESIRTQEYLKKYLEDNGFLNQIISFNGTNNNPEAVNIFKQWAIQNQGSNIITSNILIDKKQSLINYFENNAKIMIATEAGAEGINLQFCSLIVNYDLPWNPQRIEQRIGRCHRYGQKHDVVVINFVNQTNVADRRVFALLNEKFKLFEGVFGSSDEVLGSLESGVDFERRLVQIYDKCRTEAEINFAFDQLQKELEELISERVSKTRKSLLENFDEDVINKLRMRKKLDDERLDKHQRYLWKLSLSSLKDQIQDIDDAKWSFKLNKIVSNEIPPGIYSINKNETSYHQLRVNSPLGQHIILKSKSAEMNNAEVSFNLSTHPYRSALLERYRNTKGFTLGLKLQSNNKLDEDETLILISQTVDNEYLPLEFGIKLFDLEPSRYNEIELKQHIHFVNQIISETENYRKHIEERTHNFVLREIELYESWADDQIIPLENEVVLLRRELDSLRRKSRKESNISTKLDYLQQIKELDTLHKKKYQKLMMLQEENEKKGDELIKQLENSLKYEIKVERIFLLKWKII